MSFTCTTATDIAHELLGNRRITRESGRRGFERMLHRSSDEHLASSGTHRLLCKPEQNDSIEFVFAQLTGTRGQAPTMLDILSALVRIDVPPEVLCLDCFDTPTWSILHAYRTARAVRGLDPKPIEVELTWEQRALIAYLVATTDGQWAPVPEGNAPQPRGPITVRLDVVSHAMVAGFVAADDEQDRDHGVNAEGILGSDLTWYELRRQFPLDAYYAWAAAYPDRAPNDPALLTPLRELFPLAAFWGFVAAGTEDNPNYEPDAGY
jgi:hypothetical protein